MLKKIATVIFLIVGILWPVSVLLDAIDEMYAVSQNVKAIARIYKKDGCTVSDKVISKEPGMYVLDCNGSLHTITFK